MDTYGMGDVISCVELVLSKHKADDHRSVDVVGESKAHLISRPGSFHACVLSREEERERESERTNRTNAHTPTRAEWAWGIDGV